GINLATTPAPRLFMSNPVAMAWRPDGSDAWVVIQNSNLIARLTVDGAGIPTIAAPLVAGPSQIVRVDLQDVPKDKEKKKKGDDDEDKKKDDDAIAGKAPRGIAINSTGNRAYVFNFISRSITAIDISNATMPRIVGTARATQLPRGKGQAAIAQLG